MKPQTPSNVAVWAADLLTDKLYPEGEEFTWAVTGENGSVLLEITMPSDANPDETYTQRFKLDIRPMA